ncbi:DNA internalization-related competence protein ComEC/Rec2 [Alginatibacterium sediminis]|uniref:DNA internalization-related competence protein ComEC/Rec2 n=1 Tax=Alginatibacterium sediminis TaxID=2164068 RepID=A0A420EAW4_9ALTE|nr:DNA internalization-related competence protein ComEC/Rec2 [Alginatibacterium sediminis]RKF17794.1 DNA internalization-related competence protein ComEC/Rec2 [Alginatibacterium sediminis]
MNRYCILWLSVIGSSPFWPAIPSLAFLACTILAAIGLFWYSKSSAIVVVCALFWIYLHMSHYRDWQTNIASKAEHQLEACIVELREHDNYQHLKVKLQKFNSQKIYLKASNLSLYLYRKADDLSINTSNLIQGDCISVLARLKPARSLANPAGFNKSKWLVAQGVVGTGSVKSWSLLDDDDSLKDSLTKFRLQLRDNLDEQLEGLPHKAALLALIAADRTTMPAEQTQILQDSGLSHLFVVSGLHIGLLASFSWYALRFVLPSVSLRATGVVTLILCGGFCWFIGWPISAFRAYVVLLIVLLAKVSDIRLSNTNIVLVSASVICLIWPMSVYAIGFWLSFTAFSLVLWSLWCWSLQGWRQIVAVQFSIGFGMLPLQLAVFSYFPIVGLVLNLVFIPLFSMLLVPLLILAMLCSVLYQSATVLILGGCDKILDFSFRLLFALADVFPFGVQVSSEQQSYLWLSLLVLIVFLCFGQVSKYVVLFIASIGFTARLNQHQPIWSVLAFDVGQGSSILVKQAESYLLYDTGARFRGGYSYANSVLLPFFDQQRVSSLDWLVISHKDNDHAGGVGDLNQKLKIAQAVVPTGLKLNTSQRACMGTHSWLDLTLEFVSPPNLFEEKFGHGPAKPAWLKKTNNQSCVLRISSGKHSVLLTGDIEIAAEQFLLDQSAFKASDILLSPHHGSKSSSSKQFINAVAPQQVIHSAGSYNRYKFPNLHVVANYSDSMQWVTGVDGAIEVEFYQNSLKVSSVRGKANSAWYLDLVELSY